MDKGDRKAYHFSGLYTYITAHVVVRLGGDVAISTTNHKAFYLEAVVDW